MCVDKIQQNTISHAEKRMFQFSSRTNMIGCRNNATGSNVSKHRCQETWGRSKKRILQTRTKYSCRTHTHQYFQPGQTRTCCSIDPCRSATAKATASNRARSLPTRSRRSFGGRAATRGRRSSGCRHSPSPGRGSSPPASGISREIELHKDTEECDVLN